MGLFLLHASALPCFRLRQEKRSNAMADLLAHENEETNKEVENINKSWPGENIKK